MRFIFFLFVTTALFGADSVDLNDLWSHGNVQVGSSVRIGDMVIAIGVGLISYLLLVGSFLFGVISVSKNYLNEQGSERAALDSTNLAKLLFKPFFYMVIGLFGFNIIALFLNWYNIDIYDSLKFFYEARYDSVIGNLEASHKLMPFAQNILIGLDLSSKFTFWSLIFIYIGIYIVLFLIIITILTRYFAQDNNNGTLIKQIFYSLMVTVIGVVILGIYSSFLNNIMFKHHPNIPDIGVVMDINTANRAALRSIISDVEL